MGLTIFHRRTLRALVPVASILVPALILAVLGLRSYQAEALLLRERYEYEQRRLVRSVARRMTEAAKAAMGDLVARCRSSVVDANIERQFVAAQPLAAHVFMLRRGRLVYPQLPLSGAAMTSSVGSLQDEQPVLRSELDVQNYVIRLRQYRSRRRTLRQGLMAEHQGHARRARGVYRRLGVGNDSVAALALVGLARIARRRGDDAEALAAYSALALRFNGRHDRRGADFALLADAGAAEVRGRAALLALHRRLMAGRYGGSLASRQFYLRWVLLQLREAQVDHEILAKVGSATRWLFSSQKLGARLQRIDLGHLDLDHTRSVAVDHRTTLVVRRVGEQVLGFLLDEAELRRWVEKAQAEFGTPGAAGLVLRLFRSGELAAPPLGRAVYVAPLDVPLNYWTLAAWRSGGDPVSGAERRGRLQALTVIVGLLALLAGGIFFTYRAVRRELELAALKSDFVSTVSHELKTPLTSIRMFAEMLEQGIAGDDGTRRRYQQVIIRESERLGQLIANVLDFSRIERGTRRYDLGPEPLGELAREAVETFRRLAEGGDTRIDFRLGSEGPRVTADREAAVAALLNVLSNAAKYSRDEPTIEVFCVYQEDASEAAVVVRDRGIGIAATEHARIFEDFYRAPGAREAGVEGTGLGLSLVRRHMRACGGRVTVESVVGEGSTFSLWFVVDKSAVRGADGDNTGH